MPSCGTQIACSVNWNIASLSGLKPIAIATDNPNVTSETTNAVVFRLPSPCRGMNASSSAPSTGTHSMAESIRSLSHEVEEHAEHRDGAEQHRQRVVPHVARLRLPQGLRRARNRGGHTIDDTVDDTHVEAPPEGSRELGPAYHHRAVQERVVIETVLDDAADRGGTLAGERASPVHEPGERDPQHRDAD